MLVSSAVVDRWFSAEAGRDRPSYAQHLLRQIAAEELALMKALFLRQVAGQAVTWQTSIAFLTAQI
jgi:hypothetical protein